MEYHIVKVLINALSDYEKEYLTIIKAESGIDAGVRAIEELMHNDYYNYNEIKEKLLNNDFFEDDIFAYRVEYTSKLRHTTLENKDYVFVNTDEFYDTNEPKMVVNIQWSLGNYSTILTIVSNSENIDEALYGIYSNLISDERVLKTFPDRLEETEIISDISGNYRLDSFKLLKPIELNFDYYMLSIQTDFNILYQSI